MLFIKEAQLPTYDVKPIKMVLPYFTEARFCRMRIRRTKIHRSSLKKPNEKIHRSQKLPEISPNHRSQSNDALRTLGLGRNSNILPECQKKEQSKNEIGERERNFDLNNYKSVGLLD